MFEFMSDVTRTYADADETDPAREQDPAQRLENALLKRRDELAVKRLGMDKRTRDTELTTKRAKDKKTLQHLLLESRGRQLFRVLLNYRDELLEKSRLADKDKLHAVMDSEAKRHECLTEGECEKCTKNFEKQGMTFRMLLDTSGTGSRLGCMRRECARARV